MLSDPCLVFLNFFYSSEKKGDGDMEIHNAHKFTMHIIHPHQECKYLSVRSRSGSSKMLLILIDPDPVPALKSPLCTNTSLCTSFLNWPLLNVLYFCSQKNIQLLKLKIRNVFFFNSKKFFFQFFRNVIFWFTQLENPLSEHASGNYWLLILFSHYIG